MVSVACPLPSRAGLPRFVVPSRNATVPVAMPDPGAAAVTVAVNVTGCPKTEGLLFELTETAEFARFTVCPCNDPVLPVKFVSPL